MRLAIPEGFDEYVEIVSTDSINPPHFVVRVSRTPPDILEKLREWDNLFFEDDGQHSIEFLED